MFRLASMLYAIIGTSLAGALVIVVLTMGYASVMPIVVAAAIGAILAMPASYLLAKTITHNKI